MMDQKYVGDGGTLLTVFSVVFGGDGKWYKGCLRWRDV